MNLSTQIKKLIFCGTLLLTATSAAAQNEIIRPYLSVRSVGMGGVRMTTGLFDENFFYNPARVTANPRSRLTLLQITPEISANTLDNVKTLTGNGDKISNAFNTTGKYTHSRLQFVLPAWYLAAVDGRKIGIAVGLIASSQINFATTNQYTASGLGVIDIGPAVTIGRKFLENENLSVGFTTHLSYRISGSPNLSLIDLMNKSIQPSQYAGNGVKIDFDVGATYKILSFGDWNFNTGIAIQNILNANYLTNSSLKLFKELTGSVIRNPRTFGAGLSITNPNFFIFSNTSVALEVTDINNNAGGSIYRLLHLGAETSLKLLTLRAGINQGYLTAGVGLNLRFLTLDAATYGEEMTLNAGRKEERRYALTLGLHI